MPPSPWFAQRDTWDCGLACCVALATAAALPVAATAVTREALYAELRAAVLPAAPSAAAPAAAAPRRALPPPCVWTVELALLLRDKAGLAPTLHSTVLGVDDGHAALAFYADSLAVEAPRVRALFERARAVGVPMRERHVPLDELRAKPAPRAPNALATGDAGAARSAAAGARRTAYIALLDLRRFACLECSLGAGAFQFVFAGHYVLLAPGGYDAASDTFEYFDPHVAPHGGEAEGAGGGAVPHGCRMTAATLEAARTAAGTDEDLLEVQLP